MDVLSQVREQLLQSIIDYSSNDCTDLLLLASQPGIGKTHASITAAEKLAQDGLRVAYFMPRKDFSCEIASRCKLEEFYIWQANCADNCDYPDEFKEAAKRLLPTNIACNWFCGDCKKCLYREQANRTELIIGLQHSHITTGVSISNFDISIVDEMSISAFTQRILVPTKYISSNDYYLKPITTRLRNLSMGTESTSGPALIEALGGINCIRDGFTSIVADLNPKPDPFELKISKPADIYKCGYLFLPQLAYTLLREVDEYEKGLSYNTRVYCGGGHLSISVKRQAWKKLSKKLVLLDATANETIVSSLFNRPVKYMEHRAPLAGKIVQISTNKGAGFGKSYYSNSEHAIDKTAELVVYLAYQHKKRTNIGLISHKSTIDKLTELVSAKLPDSKIVTSYYYGARGSNKFETVDLLFVVGTPMPPEHEIKYYASIVYFDRMKPFSIWERQDQNIVDKNGVPFTFSIGGFGSDVECNAILTQLRESELYQAVYRSRPITNPATIYCISNTPMKLLRPDKVLVLETSLKIPDGILWGEWLRLQNTIRELNVIDSKALQELLGISRTTASKMIQMLLRSGEWELPPHAAIVRKRGRPALTISRLLETTTKV